MPIPLHTVPTGLLELIRARTLGRNPSELSDTVLGVIELGEFYAGDVLILSSGAPTVGGLAGLEETLTLTRRLGLKAICAALTVGAAAATNLHLQWGIRFTQAGTVTELAIGDTFIAAANAANIYSGGTPLASRWVIPAGSTIFARAVGTAGGADHSLDVVGLFENYETS